MTILPPDLIAYHASGKPLVCELDVIPYLCNFWPLEKLDEYNTAYEVAQYAPGFLGFASSGGGEMFALSPANEVVCLPFVGMEPQAALSIAQSWSEFEGMLRYAL